MALGPGKYDDICTEAREKVGIPRDDGKPGGMLLIVIGGNKGSGFACQADLATTLLLPNLLEEIARQIRADGIA